MCKNYDVIIVGSGAAGLIASIKVARDNKNVLLIEKLSSLGAKLKATGGGRCNLSNTLDNNDFMKSFGKNGKFMMQALQNLDHKDLINFFKSINVDTHIPDGFRIFPTSHSSQTILDGFKNELEKLNVDILFNCKAEDIITIDKKIKALKTSNGVFESKNIILATGGLGYPKLGATGDGFEMVKKLGHNITKLYPAMMPLNTKENWQENCTADTIAKATIKVNIEDKKIKKLKATGDLIFTKKGLRGPVILDFAREITPYIDQYKEVPVLINITKGMSENDIINFIKEQNNKNPNLTLLENLNKLLPKSILIELFKLNNINEEISFKNLKGLSKDTLIKTLAWTPFTIIGHDGFSKAMITRGGIDLKEIDPSNMKSKIIDGLYFGGEIVDLDGPCGGYNLQWSFSSGYLAASLY